MVHIILTRISHIMFLLVTYHMLFILYLFWTMEMMLNKKQIREILLLEFKMGCKALRTTRNINNAFGSRTANKQYSAVVVQEVLQRRQA